MSEGFVKLPREITSWCWFSDPEVLRVYIYLLTRAVFKETQWKTETLKAGQLITGRKKLSEALDISESMITRILKKLEGTGDISLETNNRYTVITLLKWEETQGSDYFFADKRTTNEQQRNNERTQNKKEYKENNSKNSYAHSREKKYDIYNGSIDWSLMDMIINN